jgi:hypothetical protein
MNNRRYFLLIFIFLVGVIFTLVGTNKKILVTDITNYQLAQVSSSLDNGLVTKWSFDEGSGTTASDSVGGNNGTLTGGPSWATGKVGGAISLSGAGNQYISLPNLSLGTNPFTVSAWVNPVSVAGKSYNYGAGIISNTNSESLGDFYLGVNSQGAVFFYNNRTGGNDSTGVSYTQIDTNIVPLNTWTLITAIWDGTSKRIFVNGVEKTGLSNKSLGTNNGSKHTIGLWSALSTYSFNGLVDDVRLYNRALSVSEVSQLYTEVNGDVVLPSAPPVVSDTQPPSVPTGLNLSNITQNSITLSWTASSDNVAVTGYKIYRNGNQINTTSGTSFVDSALSPTTTYSYSISAYDGAANNSVQSSVVQGITLDSTNYNINTTILGSGSGTITCGGITCPSSVSSGNSITFTATPTNDSTFSVWGGSCSGSSNSCTIIANSDITVSASFSKIVTPPISSTDIIPADRRIDWSNVGIPGGIPNRTTICANIKNAPYNAAGDGITDDSAAIASAIAACSVGQVVYIPAGTYRAGITLNKGVVIRGDGAQKTIINGAINMHKGYAINDKVVIVSGTERGSDTVEVADNKYIKVGDHILFEAGDNPGVVNRQGYEGTPAAPARGQIVEVTAINGKRITFKPPLYWELSSVNYVPTVKILTRAGAVYENYLERAGVESLTLIHDPSLGFFNNALTLQNCAYCWVKNVEIDKSGRAAIQLFSVYRSEISHNYLHHTTMSGSGGGYGIVSESKSTDNLFTDNILDYHSGSILIDDSIGNVVSYNYIGNTKYRTSNWLQATIGSHSTHPMMNLFEGNVGSVFRSDFIHGSASHFTIFRNRFTGYESDAINQNNSAITIHSWNRFFNVVGNVLGTAGKSTSYSLTSANFNTWNIYWLGYSGALPVDDITTSSLLRHGNYDYVTNSTIWDPQYSNHTLPASLYLSSAPSWFGSVSWPPIGPDVSGLSNKIPAQICFERGEMPGCLAPGNSSSRNLFQLVNGRCSNIVNICSSGILMDLTDTATDNIWQCLGASGGNRSSCDIPKSNSSPDNVIPQISNINTSGATGSSVNVSFKTNEISDTQIQYGITTAYESGTGFNSTLSTSHNSTLVNLKPQTLYHFRVLSSDGSGNTAISSDFTFSTTGNVNNPISLVNGLCSTTLNSCSTGTFSDKTDSPTEYLWSCLGSNGGNTASCSLPIVVTTPTPTPSTPDTTLPTNE